MNIRSKIQSPFLVMPVFSLLLIYIWVTMFSPVLGQPFDTRTDSDNLLSNSQYDEWENGSAVDWDVSASHPDDIQYAISETVGFVNGSGLYIDVSNNERGTVKVSSASVDVTSNTNYFFKSFYKTDTALSLLVEMNNIDGSVETQLIRQLPDYDYEWSSLSGSFATGPKTTSLSMYIVITEHGYLELDAAYLISGGVAQAIEKPNDILKSTNWEPFQTGVLTTSFEGANNRMHTSVSSVAIGQAGWVPSPQAVKGFEQYQATFTYQSDEVVSLWVDYTRADGSSFYRELRRLHPTPVSTTFTVPIEIPFDAITVQPSLQMNRVGDFTFSGMVLQKSAEAASFEKPIISITFDDGWESSYTNGARILDEHEFSGTFYINPGFIETPEYMKRDQLVSLLDGGHQIGAHTNKHIDLTSFTMQAVEDDMAIATEYIYSLGVDDIDFASPFGKIDDAILPTVMESSLSHRGTQEDVNTKQNYDVEHLQGLFIRKETTDDQLKEYIQRTLDSNGWLILIYHRVEATDQFFDVELATFERHMKIVSESDIDVRTVRSAIETLN